MASADEIEVLVVLPGGHSEPGFIDPLASFASVKEDIVEYHKLGDASSYELAVRPRDPSAAIGRYTPAARDVLVLLEARTGRGAAYRPKKK